MAKQTTWTDEDAELAATLARRGYGPTALSELMHFSPKTIARMLAYKNVEPGRIKYRQRRWTTHEEAEYAARLHDAGMPAWEIAECLSRCRDTVTSLLAKADKRSGRKTPRKRNQPPRRPDIRIRGVVRLLRLGHGITAIARIYRTRPATIRARLRAANYVNIARGVWMHESEIPNSAPPGDDGN